MVAAARDPTTSDVDLAERVVRGAPAQALLEAAEGADLLIVGSRGRGGFAGLLLGSVSQQCAQHATWSRGHRSSHRKQRKLRDRPEV